jgi:hypothetical protein
MRVLNGGHSVRTGLQETVSTESALALARVRRILVPVLGNYADIVHRSSPPNWPSPRPAIKWNAVTRNRTGLTLYHHPLNHKRCNTGYSPVPAEIANGNSFEDG